MRQSLLQKSSPVLVQAIAGILIGIIVVTNTAITDHVLHDFYVKPTIGTCFPSNQEDYCMMMRELHGVHSMAQLELGDIYWQELNRQAIFIGVILFIFRFSITLMYEVYNGTRKIRLIDVYIAFLWGITASLIFIGGFLDLAYYLVQDEPIPETLPWLNDVGIFQYTQGIFGDPDVVDIQDLYISILITFKGIILLWVLGAIWWSQSNIKRVL